MMDSFFVAGILLFSVLSAASGEECACFNYLIGEGGLSPENEVISIEYEIEEIRCDGDGVYECKTFCQDMFNELTNKGDLCFKMAGEEKTVGQWICESINRDICSARAGGFAKSCGSDLQDINFRYKKSICCKNGVFSGC